MKKFSLEMSGEVSIQHFMFDSVFNLPLVVVGIAILILLCVFALNGLAIFSRYILPRLKLGPEESVFTSAMMLVEVYGLN